MAEGRSLQPSPLLAQRPRELSALGLVGFLSSIVGEPEQLAAAVCTFCSEARVPRTWLEGVRPRQVQALWALLQLTVWAQRLSSLFGITELIGCVCCHLSVFGKLFLPFSKTIPLSHSPASPRLQLNMLDCLTLGHFLLLCVFIDFPLHFTPASL